MRKGSLHTAEASAKIAASWTPERRTRRSTAQLGENNAMKRPEVRAKISGDKSPTKRLEVRAKQRAAWTPERRVKQCGDNSPTKCSEVRAKIRSSMLKLGDDHPSKRPEVKAKISGENNPRWLGGISREPYAWEFDKDLKKEVRRRDGYRCQRCGKTQAECDRKLDVHHIDYDKKNSDPINLTALCRSCNIKVNANRPYWTAFFQELNRVVA